MDNTTQNPRRRSNGRRPQTRVSSKTSTATKSASGTTTKRTQRSGGSRSGSSSAGSSSGRKSAPRSGGGGRSQNGRAQGQGQGRRRSSRQRHPRRNMTNPPLQHRPASSASKEVIIPPLTDADTVRIIPVGGVEEVGKNMTIVETKDDILIFDAGFQFVSDESNAPGINYILPNTEYLEQNRDKIRGLVITHGHLDHIGGIPFLLERLGNPTIYTRYLTSIMILKRQEEFPHLPKVDMQVVEPWQRIKIGNTYIRPFPVTHSIPDSMGVSVETKYGNIVISGDLKLEHDEGKPSKNEEEVWGTLGKDNNLLFIGDSTNAWQEGFSIPEMRVYTNIEKIIGETKGRLIIGTFASQFERMINIIAMCEKFGKKVVTEGRSVKTNIEIAQKAGLLKTKPGTLIPIQEMENYPSDKIVVICTGAQGEQFAALMRIATKQHRFIALTERDTIMLSSSVIPGNELSVQRLKDNLYRHGLKIIHYRASDVHSTGHGNAGELVWIREQVKPKYMMPAYGYHSMLRCHAEAHVESGFNKNNIIIPDNGSVIDIIKGEKVHMHKDKAPSEIMMVDGFTVGTRQEVVLRDRQSLSNDGMFVIIATVNTKNGKLRKSPDIISRGFVYLRESQQLLSEARVLIKKTVERQTERMHPIDLDIVKDELTNTMSAFLMQKTNKTPMVIPVLIGI